MRDAESMLDQLLSGAGERLTADRVRDTLGLASGEAVDGFLRALVEGDGRAGLDILDGLDERGRDMRTFLDQVMEAIRGRLVAGLAKGADSGIPALTAIGRRLAAIDPARLGPGGLRFQLELVVLAGPAAQALSPAVAAPAQRARTESQAPAREATPAPAAARRGRSPEPEPTEPIPEPELPPPVEPPTDDVAVEKALADPARAGLPSEGAAVTRRTELPSEGAAVTRRTELPSEGAAPAAAVDPGSVADMDALLAAWPVVVREMSRLPALKQLIIESRPIAVEDGVVTLGFPEGRAFLRDAADKRKSAIEDGLAKVIGRPVVVRCVVTNLDVYPPLVDDADAERLITEARRIFADDLADVGEVS
jgi:DNA polymerase-3 subunit gamma/tau